MTTQEFSNEFDILYNNIMSNQAPGLDEYEKSVFLTKAQDEIIKNYFNPKGNKYQEGFDDSSKRQYDFSSLIRTANLYNINSVKERISKLEKIDKRSQVFLFPEDYFLSINEIISDGKTLYSVIPLGYSEYQRLIIKPYALPVKKAAWRLLTDKKNCNYIQEYAKVTYGTGIDMVEVDTQCDYKFLSTWADQKRNISLNISVDSSWDASTDAVETFTLKGNTMKFKCSNPADGYGKITADCKWSADKLTYIIRLTVGANQAYDDDEIVNIIKDGFKQLRYYIEGNTPGGWTEWIKANDSDLRKAATHADNFISLEAPSKFLAFHATGGKTLVTKVVQLPIAEIIGKFFGSINYQIRYVKKPIPIILTDLKDEGLSIRGEFKETKCELASELHQEILQRAVELAKSAYTGTLDNSVELGKRSE